MLHFITTSPDRPGSVVNRKNLHLVRYHPIYYSVALNNDLPDVLVTNLRDNPSRHRELSQTLRCGEFSFDEQIGNHWGIECDEQEYCAQVVQCLIGPCYFSH